MVKGYTLQEIISTYLPILEYLKLSWTDSMGKVDNIWDLILTLCIEY